MVEEGEVSEDIIDNCVRNILRMKFRLGLFDNPYCYTENPEYFTPEALAAAQKAAGQGGYGACHHASAARRAAYSAQ